MTIPKPARRGRKPRRRIQRRAWPRRARIGRGNALSSYRGAVLDADAVWRQVVMLERGPWCVCGCGRRANQCHHGLGKGAYPGVRHDPRNGFPVAQGCHRRLHGDHEENRDLMIAILGAEGYEGLLRAARSAGKTDPELAAVALRARLAELEGR